MSSEDTGPKEKTMAERAMEVGRDGAYLEVDAKDLVSSYKSGELQKAKIIVIKAARIELSDSRDVNGLVENVKSTSEALVNDGLSDEQVSLCSLRRVLAKGML